MTTDLPPGIRSYRDVPGPQGIPLLGNARQIQAEIFHLQLERWARQFGRTFRFRISNRNFLAITDPELISWVLRQRPTVFAKGPRLVQVAKDLGFHGVFTANDEAWRWQRQLVMAGLDPGHLKVFLPAVEGVTRRLKERWTQAAREQRSIDLLADLMRYTVDVTTCLAFGRNLDTLGKGGSDAIQLHLNVILPTLLRRALAPVDVEHWLPRRAVRRHVVALREAVQGFIRDARLQIGNQPELVDRPENLLQALVAACDHISGGGLSDEDLSGNVLTMLLAGEDTTANTLGWLIWLLHSHPADWTTARAEVDAVVGMGSVPRSLEQLSSLAFIDACAHEAMRLKPVAPVNIVHATQDVLVGDVAVPKGTFVTCVMRPAGLDPDRFHDPQAFRPSRWLQGGESAGAGVTSAKRVVMPFGAGPRVCPGRYLALAEIKMVMAMLLANFDIAILATPEGGPGERLSLTMSPVGITVQLSLRTGSVVEAASSTTASSME